MSRALGVFGICAALTLIIDFGDSHRENADTLIPVLVSLYKWTPYYWAQDRYGMLVPFLATAIRNPLANLLFQEGVLIFSGLASFFLASRLVFRRGGWLVSALFALACFLAFAPVEWRDSYIQEQPYGLSLALGLGGLLLVDTRARPRARFALRLVVGTALVVLGYWCNVAVGALLGPLIGFRLATDVGADSLRLRRASGFSLMVRACRSARFRARQGAAAQFGLLMIGLVAGTLLMRLGTPQPHFGVTPPREWPHAWSTVVQNLRSPVLLWLLAGSAGVAGLSLLMWQRDSRALLRAVGLLGAAVSYFLGVATSSWVALNGWGPKYLLPGVMLALCALFAAALAPWFRCLGEPWRRRAALASVTLALVAAVAAYGRPSLALARAQIAQRDELTVAVLSAKCTHVTGDYWQLWPTVFRARLARYEAGNPIPVFGLGQRSEASDAEAARVPRASVRVCLIGHQLDAAAIAFAPLDFVGKFGSVAVFQPRH